MIKPHETSLSKLDDHDWHILQHRWARGIDWIVHRIGRKWEVIEAFGKFPLFSTKSAAYEMATNLILAESHHRGWLQMLKEGRV